MATASGICKQRSTDRPRGDDDDVVKAVGNGYEQKRDLSPAV